MMTAASGLVMACSRLLSEWDEVGLERVDVEPYLPGRAACECKEDRWTFGLFTIAPKVLV